ncbi:MAG: AMP-binding protein [Chloroflexi bacterium]|nr:AMP-binding protein [Chloroflexota bacterium]
MKTIPEMLAAHANSQPDAIAIMATERLPLTYHHLHVHIKQVVAILNELGINRNDRVAIVLPNGPEMAVAFLAVAAGATSAPLNPAYRAREFDFYLEDLNAKVLVVQKAFDSPARAVAQARGIPIIELEPVGKEAGLFTLISKDKSPSGQLGGLAQPDDVALILHTSGTTSRPKMVPLTHRNLYTSALNIADTLQLTATDRCLNVMPLFHIHGLMAATLSSLMAGGSLVCTTGFDAGQFFAWINAFQPTWYTAVPTMHQAVLANAAAHHETISHSPLRFIRSSSASLPPKVMGGLEELFRVPVIESYGMTEASHQMSSNPLPPHQQKPGSVGLPAGPEVAIMGDNANLLPFGSIGEIVIRGASVTQGYANNPEANQNAFSTGWFRTGDQGYFDAEGYLFITGRLKEMINRGGENIAPREVDERLLAHPLVKQAVTFAVPHETLGEDIAAAVILKENVTVTERELRQFAFSHLSDYKVPTQILIVDQIPKGPTGKLQRIGLAEKLADKLKPEFIPPSGQIEEALARIWADVSGKERVGRLDNFFALGNDSLMATQVVVSVQTAFDVKLPLPTIFQEPTLMDQARVIEEMLLAKTGDAGADSYASLVLIQPYGSKRPFFLLPGGGGGEEEFLVYAQFIHLLDSTQPVYGFIARGQDGVTQPHTNVAAMVDDYLHELRDVQPRGPYLLGGECVGGKVAYEMARRLDADGESVALLLLNTRLQKTVKSRSQNKYWRDRLKYHWEQLQKQPSGEKTSYLLQKLSTDKTKRHIQQVRKGYNELLQSYVPAHPYKQPIMLIVSEDYDAHSPNMGVEKWAGGGFAVYPVTGDLYSYLGAHAQTTAQQVQHCLQLADEKTSNGDGESE